MGEMISRERQQCQCDNLVDSPAVRVRKELRVSARENPFSSLFGDTSTPKEECRVQ